MSIVLYMRSLLLVEIFYFRRSNQNILVRVIEIREAIISVWSASELYRRTNGKTGSITGQRSSRRRDIRLLDWINITERIDGLLEMTAGIEIQLSSLLSRELLWLRYGDSLRKQGRGTSAVGRRHQRNCRDSRPIRLSACYSELQSMRNVE
jgi:hypothetical protein